MTRILILAVVLHDRYPYICWNAGQNRAVWDDWCIACANATQRVKYVEQCRLPFTKKNSDGSFTCQSAGTDGDTCDDGDDDMCDEGFSCAHGPGGFDGPLGGDADASDAVLYPYVCCSNQRLQSGGRYAKELYSITDGVPGSGRKPRKRRLLIDGHESSLRARRTTWSVTDEWCELVAPNGTRVKYAAQCATNYYLLNGDGSYTCSTFGYRKTLSAGGVVLIVIFACCCECMGGVCEACGKSKKKKNDDDDTHTRSSATRIARSARPSRIVRKASSSLFKAVSSSSLLADTNRVAIEPVKADDDRNASATTDDNNKAAIGGPLRDDGFAHGGGAVGPALDLPDLQQH